LASWSQSDDKAQGEVRKVDHDSRKITIKHGQIKSLDMPPMTMAFTVKDPALLDAAQAGDKVRFVVVREDGKFVVTAIEVAP
jgi:Cu/Ag efflux protein CusF